MGNCSITGGCVAKGTKVLMADGSERRIEDIRVGDMISSADSRGTVVNVWRGVEEEMISIETEKGRSLVITGNHDIYTDKGLVNAKDVKVGANLVTEDNSINKVKSLAKVQGLDEYTNRAEYIEVYNLDVQMRDNSKGAMICEGIIVVAGF